MASRRSMVVGDEEWEDSEGSSTSVHVAVEDRRATRQVVGVQMRRSRAEAVPQHISMLQRHFPGRRGLFTELALFRRSAPRMRRGVERMLQTMISALALMRIATPRAAAECEFCSRVDAPMCAIAPDIHPVGAKQHANARSSKCIVARAFNTAPTTRARLLAFFANEHGELRLLKDTDDQDQQMHMLPLYASTLWKATHLLGVQTVVDGIDIVLLRHGLPVPISSHHDENEGALEACFRELVESAEADAGSAELVARLVAQHRRMFAGDYADLAMHAVVVVLDHLTAQTPRDGVDLDEFVPPTAWLLDAARGVHKVYPAETYTGRGGTVTVQRTHAQAQAWLDAWKLSTHSDSDWETPEPSPPWRFVRRGRRGRRSQHTDSDQDDDDRQQDEADLARTAIRPRGVQTDRGRDESRELVSPSPAKRRRIHPPDSTPRLDNDNDERDAIDDHDSGVAMDDTDDADAGVELPEVHRPLQPLAPRRLQLDVDRQLAPRPERETRQARADDGANSVILIDDDEPDDAWTPDLEATPPLQPAAPPEHQLGSAVGLPHDVDDGANSVIIIDDTDDECAPSSQRLASARLQLESDLGRALALWPKGEMPRAWAEMPRARADDDVHGVVLIDDDDTDDDWVPPPFEATPPLQPPASPGLHLKPFVSPPLAPRPKGEIPRAQADDDSDDETLMGDSEDAYAPTLPPVAPPRLQLEPAVAPLLAPRPDGETLRARAGTARFKVGLGMLAGVAGCACVCSYTYRLGWARSEQHLTDHLAARAYAFLSSLPPPPPPSG